MEPLKYIYSETFIFQLAASLAKAYPKLEKHQFQKSIFAPPWKDLELKERMSRISDVMIEFLPKDLDLLFPILKDTIDHLRRDGAADFNFAHMFFPEIVQKTGLSEFSKSMKALEFITVFSSAEYAIRVFYLRHHKDTNKQMLVWSKHKDPGVRRLASEGSRPLLPWGLGVPDLKKNPGQSLPILENLWDDEDEVVRRSVANHLNDISKLDKDMTWDFCKSKFGKSGDLDKSLKHAVRTLLKRGHKQSLNHFSYDTEWSPEKVSLRLENDSVRIGEKLEFNIAFDYKEKKTRKVRMEYLIEFVLANGKTGRKIFQLGEKTLHPGDKLTLTKKHNFALITTRTYYPGKHKLILVMNGKEIKETSFLLVKGKK
ncbi:DNA alkylation repair protein [Leptospira ilyithenensis]|uniref:DNA alkylation repair protein n=1 Tax=Leptospira ilyithenensis TaxID=2484901 RepID=A0A4R9LJ58_9LEPT|nr:DNA alkylation repair protein [Leptospira ilyithenensis]TGN06907.1 DNA alkylation repair protein [Leptospira ilyithenensis]